MTVIRKTWHFFKRDAIEAMSYKTQAGLSAIQIIANCTVFYFLSRYFSKDLLQHLIPGSHPVDYFPYILLGIALADFQSIALQSFSKAIYRELGSGTLEAILVTPTSLFEVMIASFFWSFAYAVTRLAFYLGLGVFLFKISFPAIHLFSTLSTLGLTITSLSGFGLISAGNALLSKRGDPLEYAMRGLSKFLSGVYFPVTALPVWIQGFSFCLPLTFALKALRECLMQGADIFQIIPELVVLILFSGVMLPAGFFYFKWAFKKAKKEGSLSFA